MKHERTPIEKAWTELKLWVEAEHQLESTLRGMSNTVRADAFKAVHEMMATMEEDMRPKTLGAFLRCLRTAQGCSLRDVDKATGVNHAYLSQLESGKIANPGFKAMVSLSRFYQIDLEDLGQILGGESVKTEEERDGKPIEV